MKTLRFGGKVPSHLLRNLLSVTTVDLGVIIFYTKIYIHETVENANKHIKTLKQKKKCHCQHGSVQLKSMVSVYLYSSQPHKRTRIAWCTDTPKTGHKSKAKLVSLYFNLDCNRFHLNKHYLVNT